MKKITLKGFKVGSPRKEPSKNNDENGSRTVKNKNKSRSNGPKNSECFEFCDEACGFACNLNSPGQENESPKQKSKGGIFSTIKRKLTQKRRDECLDCEGHRANESGCNQSDHCRKHHACELSCSSHFNTFSGERSRRRARSSRSAERPVRSKSEDAPRTRMKNRLGNTPHSPNMGRKHICGIGTVATEKNKRKQFGNRNHIGFNASSDSSKSDSTESDKEESVHIQEKSRLFLFDPGYGHASAPYPISNIPGNYQGTPIHNGNTYENAAAAIAGPSSEILNPELDLSPNQTSLVPAIQPVYDQVKDTQKETWSLTAELFKLSHFGWYWGPITRIEAEEKLADQTDGSFLVRDSSDERYLLSLSFRSFGRTLHTRIEHCNGVFSFYTQPESEGYSSIVDLIEHSISDSQSGVFCYSRTRTPGSVSFPVRLTKPVSRFTQVRSLQYLCRFVIRQYTRVDHIQTLPLPSRIKGWLQENQY